MKWEGSDKSEIPIRTNFVQVHSTGNYSFVQGFYLLGVGLKLSGAYYMVRAAVGRDVSLVLTLQPPTFPWLSAYSEEASDHPPPPPPHTHNSPCTIYSITRSIQTLVRSSPLCAAVMGSEWLFYSALTFSGSWVPCPPFPCRPHPLCWDSNDRSAVNKNSRRDGSCGQFLLTIRSPRFKVGCLWSSSGMEAGSPEGRVQSPDSNKPSLTRSLSLSLSSPLVPRTSEVWQGRGDTFSICIPFPNFQSHIWRVIFSTEKLKFHSFESDFGVESDPLPHPPTPRR